MTDTMTTPATQPGPAPDTLVTAPHSPAQPAAQLDPVQAPAPPTLAELREEVNTASTAVQDSLAALDVANSQLYRAQMGH